MITLRTVLAKQSACIYFQLRVSLPTRETDVLATRDTSSPQATSARYKTRLEGVLGQLFPSWQPSGMVYPLLAAVPPRPLQLRTSVVRIGTAKGMGCWGEGRGERAGKAAGEGGKANLCDGGRVGRIKELQAASALGTTPFNGGALPEVNRHLGQAARLPPQASGGSERGFGHFWSHFPSPLPNGISLTPLTVSP